MFDSVGVIGTGAMGSAVARLVADKKPLYLSNRTPEKVEKLAAELSARVSTNEEIAKDCDLIFLAVKPQMLPEVLSALAPVFASRADRFVLVTMAAGLTCDTIKELSGGAYPVIRMMPNTPITVGAGIITYCGSGAAEEELSAFAALLADAGTLDRIDEHLIDAASALAGCGPAFVDLFLEALSDGAVACGLPRKTALLYAAQTVEGAAKAARLSGEHPGRLKDVVCSPAGSTIQGVRALERGGFRSAAMEAVIAAYERNLELKKGE
ncbi:MAG: pyrroline-5-carboxylate reductase [Clostridia bacterium]|nr:pyrroline-5-carboxylate reductase [Clostridia bacterium]